MTHKIVKISIIFLTVSLLSIFLFSCSKDEEEMQEEVLVPEFEHTTNATCEEVESNEEGTSCCVFGKAKVSAGETVTYNYCANLANQRSVEWKVISGKITIITQGESSVTVRFENDFTTGELLAFGKEQLPNGFNGSCSDLLVISL